MGKRIQLLVNIVKLKKLPLSNQDIENMNKKSIEELKQSVIELETIDISKNEIKLPIDTIEYVKSYVGGEYENNKYKNKYLKYKNKYLKLKQQIV